MRIDILAIGSQGDVQPSVALGVGLKLGGHYARVVTLGGFETLVRRHGLDHLRIGDTPQEIANTAAGRDWIERRVSTIGFLRGFVRVAASTIEAGIASYWQACRDVEALIVPPMGLPIGIHIAERLGVPLIRASFAPTRHDWAGRTNLVTALRGELSAFSAAVFRILIWNQLRHVTNSARRNILELPPLPLREPFGAMNRQRIPVLDAYSPSVVPGSPDCGSWIHVTGYWFLDDTPGWLPPSELVDFLGSGSPPLFVGFGSTPFPEPEAATDIVVGALTRARQRGVVVAGGSRLRTGRLTDDVLSIDSVPHSWLFPQVSAAVHHGGAGVTGAALRADLPSVVVPVFGDQPFWGRQVFQLGAGSCPIPVKQLTADNLADAIRRTADREMRRRAAALGAKIRKENGVARAIEAIQDYLAVAA
ncbi:MAG TPA: glycosyltransferase [Vicinamibacterales bacterium]|jgi:UDP:flavonoid glycosyltransferase YjiC (YdhE family)|nr:glycosyltransferase [Vicinamibacterales bacterium]